MIEIVKFFSTANGNGNHKGTANGDGAPAVADPRLAKGHRFACGLGSGLTGTVAEESKRGDRFVRVEFDPQHKKEPGRAIKATLVEEDGSPLLEDPEPPRKGRGRPRKAGSVPSPAGDTREADDDPHRLARLYLDRHSRDKVATLALWAGNWFTWLEAENRYVQRDEAVIRAEVTAAIKREFDRLNREKLAEWQAQGGEDKGPPPVALRVTGRLVGDVLGAMASLAGVLVDSELPAAWRGEEAPPFPAHEMMNFRDCSIHLPTLMDGGEGYRVPRSAALFALTAVDYDFDENPGEPAEALKWLDSAFPEDPDAIRFVQEFFGWLIDPRDWTLDLQKVVLVAGLPRSGKGTMLRLVEDLIGKSSVAVATFKSLRGSFGLAKLVGKTVLAIADARATNFLGNGQDPVVEVMLNISGQDKVAINRKFKAEVECHLRLKQVIFSNRIPEVRDGSSALLARLVCLAMFTSFAGREDHGLGARLKSERTAILMWAIEGARRLKGRGRFVEPASAIELRREAEEAITPILRFADERLEFGPDYYCLPVELFDAYKAWFHEHGLEKEARTTVHWLGRDIRDAALPPIVIDKNHRDQGGHTTAIYRGVRIKPSMAINPDWLRSVAGITETPDDIVPLPTHATAYR